MKIKIGDTVRVIEFCGCQNCADVKKRGGICTVACITEDRVYGNDYTLKCGRFTLSYMTEDCFNLCVLDFTMDDLVMTYELD